MAFETPIAHQKLKDKLIAAFKEERNSHALLFLGKNGSGTLPLAIEYAKMLIGGVNPDGATKKMLEGYTHPDFHFSFPVVLSNGKTSDGVITQWREMLAENAYMDIHEWIEKISGDANKKGVIGKDESQAIIKKLNLKSYQGGNKVMLIWMANEMNISAANKLLKIIEEPPAKTYFLLVAENHESILPTILSRTQIIKVPKYSTEVISNELQRNYQVNNDVAYSLASLSEGDFNKAKTLVLEQDSNATYFDVFVSWMRLCYKKDVNGLIDWTDDIATLKREKLKTFLEYGLHVFRQCMLGKYGTDALTAMRGNESDFVKKFGTFIHGKNVIQLNEQFNTAHYHLERNGNGKIIMLDLSFTVLKLLHIKP